MCLKMHDRKSFAGFFFIFFSQGKMNENFVEPDYYLVSYWPGTNPSDKNTKTVKTESMS